MDERHQRFVAALREAVAALESWQVDDPQSPFVGEAVVSRDDVFSVLDIARRIWKSNNLRRRTGHSRRSEGRSG